MREPTAPRRVRYYRRLEHGDFSLEANTESTPEPGRFYVLQGGQVLLRSDDFRTAEAAYHELCRGHWEGQLTSDDPARRMASAWGLLGLEPTHRSAADVVRRDGRLVDQARLERIRAAAPAEAPAGRSLTGSRRR